MYDVLERIREMAINAQGEWADVMRTFSPGWTHTYKDIIEKIDEFVNGD